MMKILMKTWKVIKCPKCGNYLLTRARTSVECRYCGNRLSISKAYRKGYVKYHSDSWINAMLQLQKLEDKLMEEQRKRDEKIIEYIRKLDIKEN